MAATTARSATTAQHADGLPAPWVIHVRGVMDLDHLAELSAALLSGIQVAHEEGRADLVVDLTHSSFCDSSGLGALLRARRAAAEQGITVRLAAPSHQMLRLLELTGTQGLFPLLESRQAGAASVASPAAACVTSVPSSLPA
ncbi:MULTISPECIES: STAS domain-containing protein [unclassified Streptomyces]|uniref:STAS domain-containing protein n=1 Tax=unclassified Streptomyces TaxID=2593676 RepID=UPI0038113CA0